MALSSHRKPLLLAPPIPRALLTALSGHALPLSNIRSQLPKISLIFCTYVLSAHVSAAASGTPVSLGRRSFSFGCFVLGFLSRFAVDASTPLRAVPERLSTALHRSRVRADRDNRHPYISKERESTHGFLSLKRRRKRHVFPALTARPSLLRPRTPVLALDRAGPACLGTF